KSIVAQKTAESYNVLKNVSKSISETIYKEADYSSIRISQNGTLSKLMQINMDSYESRDYQKEIVIIQKLFFDNTFRRYIDYIGLMGENQFFMESSSVLENSMHEMINDPDFEKFRRSSINYWRGPIEKINGSVYKVFARKVYNSEGKKILGYVFIWINERGVREIFDSYRNEITGTLMVLNTDGNIFATTGTRETLGNNIHQLFPGFKLSSTDTPQRLVKNKKEYLICIYKDDFNSLYSVNFMPLDSIVESTNSILAVTAVMMVTLFLFCILAATFLSRYFTVPILKLAEIMTISDIGQVRTDFVPRYNDEVGYLARCFNQMAEKLNYQAVVIENTQRKQREAELKAFESQIKPHFLYNTLSTVIWLIGANQSQSAIKVTSALSRMFRISISRGSNIIPIEKEIEHVSCYLDIQKVRYENEFVCRFDIEEETLNFYIVKMVLQPLVENAIYHSMRYMENGEIVISCKQIDGFVVLQVRDNGGFMSEEKCALINAKLENRPFGVIDMGVGIKNVHDRIRFTYGAENGL
ncbi:MAG: sensor histidine kinase, partial [Clostridiaceae bacterium]|nr:sensor histidine kinase [Clostridiaceae bacterium]